MGNAGHSAQSVQHDRAEMTSLPLNGSRSSVRVVSKSKRPVYKWFRILMREVGVKSADERSHRHGHKPEGSYAQLCSKA
jgi:hypothetical protein